ncbi:MAG: hypothetical protein KDB18_13565, partial [Salinibacterium sp.]|nr:hypothetical protein [Salinibacterium sp.]
MIRQLQTISLVAALTLTVRPVLGQGVGTPSGTGFVPSLDFDHFAVGSLNRIRVTDLSPGSPMALFVGEAAQPVSLANLGLGPAVLSPGPNGPAPTVTITGLTSDAAGALELPFVADPSLVHLIFYFQALALDAAAPFGGVNLSESRAVAFGLAPRGLALAVAAGAGRHTLVQVFPGGALAAPIEPRLTSLALLDASLTNDNEMSFARDDRPVADAVADLAQGLRLADGSLLMLGVGLNHEARLLRVDRRGRIEALFEAQGTATELAFAPEMAVSAHDPYLALVLENPLPGLGAALLILVRTDGKNIPGSHLSFRGVAT